MKSHESTLAFSNGRRLSLPTVYSRRTSIFISFLSIFSLLSSVTAIQQQVVNQHHQQRIPSSFTLTNETTTTTTTTAIITLDPARQQIALVSSTSSISDEFLNETNVLKAHQVSTSSRTTFHKAIIILICSIMCGMTVLGNLVVILTVCLVRKLRTASNILIVSLAVSDIFVGLFVMPIALVYETSGQWRLGRIMCDIWTSSDVLLCTSSILNFLVISIDRYFIINHPFKYAPMRKVKLLSFMIAGVWILSALVSLPPVLGWGLQPENPLFCSVNPELNYQIFATMLSFYIPLIAVLIIYANIYRTAQTAMDTRSSVQMSQFLSHNNSTANFNQTISGVLSQQQTNGNSCSSPQLYLNVSNSNKLDDSSSTSGPRILSQSGSSNSSMGGSGRKRSSKRSGSSLQGSKSPSFLSPARCLGRRISTPFNGRLSIFVSRRYTFFRHVHLPNQKAIRTLGVILGTFIVCWLPFMLYAIIKAAHIRITGLSGPAREINAPVWLDPVLLWFGYSSSMLNPIIYSKFNREFRTPFREIICFRCKGLNEKIRRQEYLENLYGENHLQTPAQPHVTNRISSQPEAAV